MTERHQIIGFPLRAREHEQRDILTVHAIHHMRHESIAIQASTRANQLHIIVG